MASQQRIAALVDQLIGLGAKRTGMPVAADDWNALVDAVRGVLDVAAAQEAANDPTLDQRFALADHSHLAEVTNEWLAAELRAAIGTGTAPASVGAAVANTRTGAQLNRLLEEAGRLRLVQEDQQARIDRAVVGDLDRTKEVTDLRGKVAAVNDLRGVVNGLEDRLRTTSADIGALNTLRDSLTDAAGVPIDVGALKTSVTELARLRENLTDAQGNLVRMSDVLAKIDEQRANEPGGDLDGRFDDLRSQLDTRLSEQMATAEGQLRLSGDERAAQLRSDLTAQLDSSAAASRVEVERSTDARIAAAEQRLDASVAAAADSVAASLRPELTALVRTTVRDGLADVDGRITAAVDAARAAVHDSLSAELTDAASAAADARTAAVLDPLRSRVDELSARLTGLDDAVQASVTASLDARLSQLLDEVDTRTTAALDQARAALAQTVSTEVDRAMRTGSATGREDRTGRRQPAVRRRRAHRPTGGRPHRRPGRSGAQRGSGTARRHRPQRHVGRTGNPDHHLAAGRHGRHGNPAGGPPFHHTHRTGDAVAHGERGRPDQSGGPAQRQVGEPDQRRPPDHRSPRLSERGDVLDELERRLVAVVAAEVTDRDHLDVVQAAGPGDEPAAGRTVARLSVEGVAAENGFDRDVIELSGPNTAPRSRRVLPLRFTATARLAARPDGATPAARTAARGRLLGDVSAIGHALAAPPFRAGAEFAGAADAGFAVREFRLARLRADSGPRRRRRPRTPCGDAELAGPGGDLADHAAAAGGRHEGRRHRIDAQTAGVGATRRGGPDGRLHRRHHRRRRGPTRHRHRPAGRRATRRRGGGDQRPPAGRPRPCHGAPRAPSKASGSSP